MGLLRSGRHGRSLSATERRGLLIQVVAGILGIGLMIVGLLQIVRAGDEHSFGGVLVAGGGFVTLAGGYLGMRAYGLPVAGGRLRAAALLLFGFAVVVSLVGYLRGR